jgi:multiple sugar transport system ATP-binding protein
MDAGASAGLEIRGLSKVHPGAIHALRELSLDVAPRELLAVVGPSGCGKSTLLRLVAGLDSPTSGEVRIAGERANEWSPRERDVALVLESHSLFPHMSAFDNMAYGLRLRGTARAEIAARVEDAARTLGLEGLLARRPAQLSGGERQRVALGRALVRRPRLLLLDEPLSSLDAHLRAELRQEIVRVHRRLGAMTLLVTHDQAEALSVADRVAVLEAGALQQVGAPASLYESPSNRFVAGFIGVPAASFFEGRLVAENGHLLFQGPNLTVRVPEALRSAFRDLGARDVVAGVRPEHWRWADVSRGGARRATRGQVEWIEWTGWKAVAHVRVGEAAVRAVCGETTPATGETVHLEPDPDRVLYFDGATGRALVSA